MDHASEENLIDAVVGAEGPGEAVIHAGLDFEAFGWWSEGVVVVNELLVGMKAKCVHVVGGDDGVVVGWDAKAVVKDGGVEVGFVSGDGVAVGVVNSEEGGVGGGEGGPKLGWGGEGFQGGEDGFWHGLPWRPSNFWLRPSLSGTEV